MSDGPDDTRAFYQRVVDGVIEQIRTGDLEAGAPVPSAKKLAEHYGVSDPTAQRALRELKVAGYTYGIPGKGTFVHPDGPVMARPRPEDIPDDPTYYRLRNQLLANFKAGHEAFDEAFKIAEAAMDFEAIEQAREALELNLKANKDLLLQITLYAHQALAQGRVLDDPRDPGGSADHESPTDTGR